jgi:hypothetical protein
MINLMGAIGFYGLVVAGVGCILYGSLWVIRKCGKGPEIF